MICTKVERWLFSSMQMAQTKRSTKRSTRFTRYLVSLWMPSFFGLLQFRMLLASGVNPIRGEPF